MKKLLFILLSAFSLTVHAQEQKTITIMQPKCNNAMVANVVKSILESAFARSDEWQLVEGVSLEQMINASVNDNGNAVGNTARYFLTTTIREMDDMCNISCKIINRETGTMEAYATELSETSLQSIQQATSSLVKQLLEKQ